PATKRLPPAAASRVRIASSDASTSAFHLGVLIAGLLMIAGGIVAGFGIENRRRGVGAVASRGSAAAGECGHGADADCADQKPLPSGRGAPEPERKPACACRVSPPK